VLSPRNLDFVPLTWLPYVDIVGKEPGQLIFFHCATRSTVALLSRVLSGFPRAILAPSSGTDPSGLAYIDKDDASRIVGLPA
jgi:hypothetical protein